MTLAGADSGFVGSIPDLYERYMVPLMFEVYAADLAGRVARLEPSCVLEIAAGTGVATRALARAMPASTEIVATDLNRPMLDHAQRVGTARPVEWRQADVMSLPFPDQSFDAVVCQFGVMFFPDKARAYSEVRRVLRPGGHFVFNVWDRIEHNEFAHAASQALRALFPDDPPKFMERVPHGYFDSSLIARDLEGGGFGRTPQFTTLTARSTASSPRIPAIAICEGTPLRSEIEARGATMLEESTRAAAAEIARRFGSGPVEARLQAVVISLEA